MNNNGHGKMPPGMQLALELPTNVAAQLTITAYHNQPPTVSCTSGHMALLHLLRIGLATVIRDMEARDAAAAKAKEGETVEFKYAGPREYGPDGEKK